MNQKMNSLLLSVANRNMYVEKEARKLRERLEHIEENVNTAKATFESVDKIAESIAESKQRHPGCSKPVSEFKAVQQLKAFAGDRSKFREWNEKLLNALAQVNSGYRQALKNLNNKLDTTGGMLDEDEDDLERIMNGKLTADEYAKAIAVNQRVDYDKGEHEFTTEQMIKLDDDLWYI